MATSINFDMLLFGGFRNINGWLLRYGSSIRSLSDFRGLRRPVGQHLMTRKTKAWTVWYTGGDWKTGKPIRATPGDRMALIRIPAVKIGDRFLVIDGCHRVTQVGPRMIVLDYVEIRKGDIVRFADFVNPFWRKYFRKTFGLPKRLEELQNKRWGIAASV